MSDNEVSMSFSDDVRSAVTEHTRQIHWWRLIVTILGFVALSFALAYLLQGLVGRFQSLMYQLAYLAYAIVFATTMISNLTIIFPVIFVSGPLMVAAAKVWDPALIALAAALGGTLGELSGYYAGYLGTKIAISDQLFSHSRIERWMKRYGAWTISFLAFQPIIPFDIGGMIAGAAKMPLHLFLPALFLGKFPKYLILIYTGLGAIKFIPFLSG